MDGVGRESDLVPFGFHSYFSYEVSLCTFFGDSAGLDFGGMNSGNLPKGSPWPFLAGTH